MIELVIYIKYCRSQEYVPIKIHSDNYTDDLLSSMQEQFKHTVFTLKQLDLGHAFDKEVQELHIELQAYYNEDDTVVLEGESIYL